MRISEKGHIVSWPILRAGVLTNNSVKWIERPFTKKDINWYSYLLRADENYTYDVELLGKEYLSWSMDDWAKAAKKLKLK